MKFARVSADQLLDELRCGRSGCECPKALPGKGHVHCPAHNDPGPSLSVTNKDGKILVHCQAGCSQTEVIGELRSKGLWPNAEGKARGRGVAIPSDGTATVQPSVPISSCTLQDYAKSKRLPVGFLMSLGLTEITYVGRPAVRMPYHNVDGTEAATRFRVALDGTGGASRFRWKTGNKPCLYGLSRLGSIGDGESVALAEGESDCQTLWWHEIPAVGVPGADNWKEDRDASLLDRFVKIYVVVEPDKGGATVTDWLAKSKIRDRVYLVHLGEHKDPSGLYLSDPEHFKANWLDAIEAAVPWAEFAASETTAIRQEAWEICSTLARTPRILERFVDDLKQNGVVGEARVAKLVYLIVTSRLLDKCVSAATKGPSSAGKSYVTEQALKFFPDSAYYTLTAMSEKALVYSEEPLSHRILVIYEAAGLQGEMASYFIRSLLSEGRLRYETVESTPEGLRPRLIEREGPTGLLITTTAVSLHPENETRLFSIPVTDTKKQTQDILRGLAVEDHEPVDMAPWHALQTWLEVVEHRVTIPFSEELTSLIPPVSVRLRRDISSLLNLIRAHAILHQASRDRDDSGRIIATIEDYAVIRELTWDLIAEGIGATVSSTVRETVSAVGDLAAKHPEGVTNAALSMYLKLDKSTASRRSKVAQEKEYIRNVADKHKPAKLVLGEPMPEDVVVLPFPESLPGGKSCAVAVETKGTSTPPPPELEPISSNWGREL